MRNGVAMDAPDEAVGILGITLRGRLSPSLYKGFKKNPFVNRTERWQSEGSTPEKRAFFL